MRLSRRQKDEAAGTTAVEELEPAEIAVGKGRPTPKRRDSRGTRGPVTAPKTRKEAYARQKQQSKEQKTARAIAPPKSAAEQRAALKRGESWALPRRDQGTTRKIARDYVDSRRMASNFLLLAFVIVGLALVPGLSVIEPAALVILVACLAECYLASKRIRAIALERHGDVQGGNMSIMMYAFSRAYLPRKWRLPSPQVRRGDEI